MKRVFLKSVMCGLAMSVLAFGVNAQSNYPDKPIKLIVPWPVGGSADAIGRMIGIGLNNQLGKQVIVENIAGAGGNIATQAFVKAQPDGYTLLLATSSTNSANPTYTTRFLSIQLKILCRLLSSLLYLAYCWWVQTPHLNPPRILLQPLKQILENFLMVPVVTEIPAI